MAEAQTQERFQIKLKDYGWQPRPGSDHEQRSEWRGTSTRHVTIDHAGRVLVGFVIRDNPNLATRDHPGISFHILRFVDGKNDLSMTLPTKDYFTAGLYLGASDQILVRANDSFQTLEKQDKIPDAGAAWRLLATCPKDCFISRSATGRTLVLRTAERPSDFGNWTYTVLDTSSLSPRVSQTCPRMAGYGENITDKFVYWNGSDGSGHFLRRFQFCNADQGEELPWNGGGGFLPLNDDAFVLVGSGSDSRAEVIVVRADGRVKFDTRCSRSAMFPGTIRDLSQGLTSAAIVSRSW